MTFGAFISTRRKEAKLNLRDTAKHLGISNGYLCDIEQGRRPAPEEAFVSSEFEKTQTAGRILEEVRGRMLEDIVLLETMKVADRGHRVFKLQFAAGEFDMVIYHEKENCCEIFEIKHSDKQVPAQYRHLADQEKCDKTERRFGPIRGRYVLYRGEDAALENGVQYRNVERYLNDLPEMDITPVQETGIQQIGPVL